MFSFEDMEKFALVARLGSMRRAADSTGEAVSAISRHIARLEQAFGATLFERRANGVVLTPAGDMFLDMARGVMQQMADLELRLAQNDPGGAGIINIHSVEGVTKEFLIPLIAAFRTEFPETSVHLVAAGRNVVLTAIEDYAADIGFVYDHFSNPGVETVARWQQPLLAFARPGHPLLSGPISLAELMATDCALPDKTFGIRRLVDAAYENRGRRVAPALFANQLQALIHAAIESDLITFMPLQAARFEVEHGLLVPIDTGLREFDYRFVSVVVHKGRPRSRQVEALLAKILAGIAPAIEADRKLLQSVPSYRCS
ncbi:LysR family transcriptional regulator [Paracoccus pacificus]|uniref:LysR family transcriptional regulator n=1 Tax=Paracoccus pacificus TaxID=1463598 RepID=A0ABW4R2I5_9RHOB